MTITLVNHTLRKRVKIHNLFKAIGNTKFAYGYYYGNSLRCEVYGHMQAVKSIKTLPSVIFGKRKGPFVKLEPCEGWEIEA